MSRLFVDRATERAALDRAWEAGRAELVIVQGRRRVGKTELLARFAEGRDIAVYVGAQQQAVTQLQDLGAVLGALSADLRPGAGPRLALQSWDEALAVMADEATRRRVGLVLDEFPYLCDAEPALPSLIQRWWDAVGSHRDLLLVISGSEQAMMLRVTSSQGALYGQPTAGVWLRPFDYFHAGSFVADWPPEDRLRTYAVAGGIPDHLEEFSTRRSFRSELLRLAYSPDGRLFRGAPDMLRAELKEPRTYESILRAMAAGEHQPSRIATLAGMKSAAAAAPYLKRLISLELVERRTPPTEAHAPRPRISRYVLADPYLRFYFALVDPFRSLIQTGHGSQVLERLWPAAFDRYVSRVFEEVAAQYVWRLAGSGRLPLLTAVGHQWLDAGDIDVVGVDQGRVVVAGSVKWTREYLKPGDLADLRRDVPGIARDSEPELLLFSRSGFDPSLEREAGVRLVGPADLFRPELDHDAHVDSI